MESSKTIPILISSIKRYLQTSQFLERVQGSTVTIEIAGEDPAKYMGAKYQEALVDLTTKHLEQVKRQQKALAERINDVLLPLTGVKITDKYVDIAIMMGLITSHDFESLNQTPAKAHFKFLLCSSLKFVKELAKSGDLIAWKKDLNL